LRFRQIAKRTGCVALHVALGLGLMLGCSKEDGDLSGQTTSGVRQAAVGQGKKKITRLADFKGKKIASLTGTAFDISINRGWFLM